MPTSATRTAVSKTLAPFAPLLMALLCVLTPAHASAQTTAFTYQGQLTEAGTGASGDYDLQFGLFDAGQNGTQIGATQPRPAVAVSNGVFTVQLDFGVSAFPGENRFLEIGVRPAGGGNFTTLTPRQQISSTPYAIRTLRAATADALSSTCTGCVQDTQIQSVAGSKVSGTIPVASVPAGSGNYIQNTTTEQPNANFNIAGNGVIDGNLTVGGTLNASIVGNFIQNQTTQQPNANFNVSGNGTLGGTLTANQVGIAASVPVLRLQDTDDTGGQVGLVSFRNPSNAETAWVGFGTASNAHATFMNNRSGGNTALGAGGVERVTVLSGGNVGIGTTAPQTKLDVRGDIRLGPSGQYRAASGEENLRVVRGVISATGGIIAGSGFVSSRLSAGNFRITFTTPFAGVPAVVATADQTALDAVDSFVVYTRTPTASVAIFTVRRAEDEFNSDRQFQFIAIGPR